MGNSTKTSIREIPSLTFQTPYVERAEDLQIQSLIKNKFDGTSATNIVIVHGGPGLGKTTMVKRAVEGFMHHKLNAVRLVEYSFPGQALFQPNEGQTPTDLFYYSALKALGATDQLNRVDRDFALLEILQSTKCLLIMDGVEAVIPTDSQVVAGVRFFLKRAVERIAGLCILTSRFEIPWIVGKHVVPIGLHPIPPEDRSKWFQQMAKPRFRMNSNQLSVLPDTPLRTQLLAGLSRRHAESDAKGNFVPPKITELEPLVAASLDTLGEDSPEKQLLLLTSMFFDSVPFDTVERVRSGQIRLLTDKLPTISSEQWGQSCKTLASLGLISSSAAFERKQIEMHAEVKKWLHSHLQLKYRNTWLEGHRAIADFFSQSVSSHPQSFEEMQFLFRAIDHLCWIGDFSKAFNEVYWIRVARGHDDYARKALAANSEIVKALSYFVRPNGELAIVLDPEKENELRQQYAFALWVNDLANANKHLQFALRSAVSHKLWKAASQLSLNIGYLHYLQGFLFEAAIYCKAGLSYAEQAQDERMRWNNAAALGSIYTYLGQPEIASAYFVQCEPAWGDGDSRRTFYPQFFLLDSLLAQKEYEKATRALLNISNNQIQNYPLDQALWKLVRGKIGLAHAQDQSQWEISLGLLQEARADFLRAGSSDELSRAELAIAQAHYQQGQFASCRLWIALADETNETFGLRLLDAFSDFLKAQCDFSTRDHHNAHSRAVVSLRKAEEMNCSLLRQNVTSWLWQHFPDGRNDLRSIMKFEVPRFTREQLEELRPPPSDGRSTRHGVVRDLDINGLESELSVLESRIDSIHNTIIHQIQSVLDSLVGTACPNYEMNSQLAKRVVNLCRKYGIVLHFMDKHQAWHIVYVRCTRGRGYGAGAFEVRDLNLRPICNTVMWPKLVARKLADE